ncbi:MAG TPA: NAD-dependent epimerase/dehydratase family protein, partial [Candidatus Eisenbacteria bacterium]
MRVLVLGGTRYLGRHLVEALLAHGHAVTLFHRGLSNPGLFPEAEHLRGDRAVSLEALAGGRWDVVFDPSGFEPRIVRASARAVAATAAHYVFVSTISVYADPTRVDPDTPVAALDGTEDSLPLTLPDYGRLKVACERAVEEVLPGRVLHVRPGLIVGPHDVDERFRWWLQRVARGGEVLAPGRPERQIQLIDVRDLAAWMMRCGERRLTGTYDATGPVPPLSMRELLETIRAVVGGEARFTWVPDEILAAHQAKAGSELPFWVPAASENIL